MNFDVTKMFQICQLLSIIFFQSYLAKSCLKVTATALFIESFSILICFNVARLNVFLNIEDNTEEEYAFDWLCRLSNQRTAELEVVSFYPAMRSKVQMI